MQHAVLDLLLDVVLAVRLVDFDRVLMLVDGRDVYIGMEILQGHREDVAFFACSTAHVVVAGVMPAADIDTGHALEGLEGSLVVLRLGISVDMVAGRSHQGIVHVAGVVPDFVFLRHAHMAHLVRKEILDDRLPHSPVVHVGGYAENRRTPVAVAYGIEAFLLNVREIDFQIIVAEEIAFPRLCRAVLDEMLAVSLIAYEGRAGKRGVAAVRLDDGDLALVGEVTHLGCLYYRRIGPSGDDVGLDIPLDGTLGGAGGDLGTDDEPAVGMVHATVVKFQVSFIQGLDGQTAVRVVRAGGERLADGIWLGDDGIGRIRAVTFADQMLDVGVLGPGRLEVADAPVNVTLLRDDRGIGLLGINALLVVHYPRLAEKVAGEKLDIEAGATQQLRRHRLVEVYCHQETFALRLQRHGIGNIVVRVDHGIEAGEMAAGVREAESRNDTLTLHPAPKLFRNRLPLARGGVEADVTVAGDAMAVHQDGDAPLMPLGIEVVERHDVHSVLVEVAGRVDVEVLGSQACRQQDRCRRSA